jgi:hypothetical protein
MFDGALLTDSQKRRRVLSRYEEGARRWRGRNWEDGSGVLASHLFGTIQFLIIYINNWIFA